MIKIVFIYCFVGLESVDSTTVLGKSSLSGKQLNISVMCTSGCCEQILEMDCSIAMSSGQWLLSYQVVSYVYYHLQMKMTLEMCIKLW